MYYAIQKNLVHYLIHEYLQICATTQLDGDDHCYAHYNFRLRFEFTVTLLQLFKTFYNIHQHLSSFILTDLEDLTDTEERHLIELGLGTKEDRGNRQDITTINKHDFRTV